MELKVKNGIKKNHWVCRRNDSFAEWQVTFPKEHMTSDWEVFQFMSQVYEAGEAEAVYHVLRVEGDPVFQAAINSSFIQYLEKALRSSGKYIGFKCSSSTARRDIEDSGFLVTARLSYYAENGEIIESEVGDVGKLLMRLRPDMLDDERDCMSAFFPISMYGQKGGLYKDGTPYQTCLGIYTRTNVWFPKVRGFPGEPWQWYDNSELALRHTPRLNRFLRRVKELTLEYGGRWELSDDQKDSISYWPMLSEDGIALDRDVLDSLPG
jgi:hypothetical protein